VKPVDSGIQNIMVRPNPEAACPDERSDFGRLNLLEWNYKFQKIIGRNCKSRPVNAYSTLRCGQ